MWGRSRAPAALLFGSWVFSSCASQPAPVQAPARAVPRDCQVFVDHFRPVATQLLEVRVFPVGEAYVPLLRPARDAARVEAFTAFLERPAPPTPNTAPTLLTSMQEIVRDQTNDTRGLLAALARGDLETYRRLSIRYRSGREQLLSLDDSLDASCGTHLSPRGRIPIAQIVASVQPHEAAFRKCYEAGRARNPHLPDHLDVAFVIDERGAVRTAEVDPKSNEPSLDPGTEPFFTQLGYQPAASDKRAARPRSTDQGVIACVLAEARTLRFDAVRGGATVTFAIMFNGQAPVLPADD
jgi:hypothetical protein